MQRSRLLDVAVCHRALKDYLGALGTGAGLQRLLQHVDDTKTSRKLTTFVGFNLFQGVHGWFLPKPTIGVARFLEVYEEFIAQDLGAVNNPGLVAERVYAGNASARRLFRIQYPEHWMTPALTLLAASLHLGAEVDEWSDTGASVRLADWLMHVEPSGCWSNLRGRMIPVVENLCFPGTTFHAVTLCSPILAAMLNEAESQVMTQAVSVLAHGLHEEVIDRKWLRANVARGESGTGPTASMQAAERAMTECLGILTNSDGDVVGNLYDAAVPALISSKEFSHRIANPSKVNPTRRVKPATLARWGDVLEQRMREITGAK